jgi:hypothetical protein
MLPTLQWLETASPQGERVMGPSFPSTAADFHRLGPLEPLSLEREFLWAASRVQLHAARISLFVRYLEDISRLALQSNFADALATLDLVERDLGASLWAIKLRIALTQKLHGFEAHQRYTLTLMDPKVDQYIQYIAHYVSMRNESALSPSSFRTIFERHRAAHSPPPPVRAYFTFHILPMLPVTPGDAANILSTEDAGSLIDVYETTVRLSAQFYASDLPTFKRAALPAIELLRRKVADVRLFSLQSALLGDWRAAGLAEVDQGPLGEFLLGNYSDALQRSVAALESGADNWDYIDLAARSSAALVATPPCRQVLWAEITSHMHQVLTRSADADEGTAELLRIGLNMDGLIWSDRIFGFLAQELGSHEFFASAHLATGAGFPPRSLCPCNALSLRHTGDSYLDAARAAYGRPLTLRYVEQFLGDGPSIGLELGLADDVAQLAKAEFLLIREPAHSLELSKAIAERAGPYFRNRALRICIAAHFALGRIKECVEYVTTIYVADDQLHSFLSIAKLTRLIDKPLGRELRADPSLAILFDMYGRHVSEDQRRKLRTIYQEFLISYDVSRPSELRAFADRIGAKLIYFLRNICIVPIMVASIAFRGSQEVESERLSVCQALIDLDPENAEDYQAEIKEITTNQAVQRGMEQVAQSKIYVDLDGVGRAAQKNLRESFNRYKAFVESDVEHVVQGVMDALRKARAADTSAIVALRLPKGGAADILEQMVSDLRDEFVSNTQYGLDGYLSQRIRHGTLQGHLRSPLEAAKLITQQESGSARYRPNVYWAQRLVTLNEKTRAAVALRLASFSAEFDALVTKIRTEWIQIKRADSDPGLFDFRIGAPLVALLSSALTADATFDVFVNTALGLLMKRLGDTLSRIRERVSTDFKGQVNGLFDRLREDLQKGPYGADHSLVGAVVAAQTDMQRAVDRMAEWFSLGAQTSDYPLPLSLAVQVAAETTNRFHRTFSLILHCETLLDPVYPLGAWVNFVDVFLILMENVVKHCGFSDSCDVHARLWEADGMINVRVSNRTASAVRTQATQDHMGRIRVDMDRGDYRKFVPREGRSGLHKIRKIVGHDLRSLDHLDFGFADDGDFVVNVRMHKELGHAGFDS